MNATHFRSSKNNHIGLVLRKPMMNLQGSSRVELSAIGFELLVVARTL